MKELELKLQALETKYLIQLEINRLKFILLRYMLGH